MATGEASAATDEQHKLTDFLTTLVTYPALYIFATASTAEPSPGDGAPEVPPQGAKGRRNAATSAVASATKRAVPPGLTGLAGGGVSGVGSGEELGSGPVMALVPEPRHRLSDFPEGRALVALERCGALRAST
ncbi:hypothetical protein PLESTB_000865600 [Pleodorina starrii]|uniref:Uncharacterized protein n=1 Tax=Pleodorina starrii TaxID=330485 RepID=A0A9W6BN82_9CHLO|nr:hypothetical protein PLESTB_000865600 [Pleodorina starrii]